MYSHPLKQRPMHNSLLMSLTGELRKTGMPWGDIMTTVVWETGSGWLTHSQCPACAGCGLAPSSAGLRAELT